MNSGCRCPSCKSADALEDQQVLVLSLEGLPLSLVWAGITLASAGYLEIPTSFTAGFVAAATVPCFFQVDKRLRCQRCQVQFLAADVTP